MKKIDKKFKLKIVIVIILTILLILNFYINNKEIKGLKEIENEKIEKPCTNFPGTIIDLEENKCYRNINWEIDFNYKFSLITSFGVFLVICAFLDMLWLDYEKFKYGNKKYRRKNNF
jgi:hypothetical protein